MQFNWQVCLITKLRTIKCTCTCNIVTLCLSCDGSIHVHVMSLKITKYDNVILLKSQVMQWLGEGILESEDMQSATNLLSHFCLKGYCFGKITNPNCPSPPPPLSPLLPSNQSCICCCSQTTWPPVQRWIGGRGGRSHFSDNLIYGISLRKGNQKSFWKSFTTTFDAVYGF